MFAGKLKTVCDGLPKFRHYSVNNYPLKEMVEGKQSAKIPVIANIFESVK